VQGVPWKSGRDSNAAVYTVVQAVQKRTIGLTVQFVSEYRKAEVFEVHADLMGPPGLRLGGDEAVRTHSFQH
jgi:hypothetical protein